MKSCSLFDFMQEIKPWLDSDHIRDAFIDNRGHFVLRFQDGMQNVYHIDDCNESQIRKILGDLKNKGIAVEE